MSKIDEYREQCKITKDIIDKLKSAQGLKNDGTKDPNNDKHNIGFYHNKIWDSDINIWFHASFGYYGSSNGYSACSPELKHYLIKALDYYQTDIIDYVIEAAERDKHLALLDCKKEAEEILAKINNAQ